MNAQLHHTALHESHFDSMRPVTPSWKNKLFSYEFGFLAAFAATGLIVGLADVGGGAFSGLCLAFGAIFFGLSFIMKAVHKAQEAAVRSV